MDTVSVWGKYAPPSKSRTLNFLIASGLSRGKLKKKILRAWERNFGVLADVTVRGVKYRLNLQNNVTDRQLLASSKEYDGVELAALKKACRNGAFIDIGANIGYYSLALAGAGVKPIIAIEPNPPTIARLRFNVSINHFEDAITILPIGIGKEGMFELFSSGDLGSASLLPDPLKTSSSVSIITRPLLDVLAEQKIDQIGGIKIDVEGMEDQVLMPFFKSAPKSLWPDCIVIEHCNKTDWKTDVISYLIASGYVKSHKTRGNTVLRKNR